MDIFGIIHFIPLLRGKNLVYYIIILLITLLIFFMAILIIVMIVVITKKIKLFWPIKILRYLLPFFSITFLGQTFLTLMTIFDCAGGHSYVNEDQKCRTGAIYLTLMPFIIIAIAFLFLISIITNLLYFKPIFIKTNSDVLKKENSYPDIVFFFTKIGIILIFILDKEDENDHWAVLFFSVLLSGINAYYSLFYQNRLNRTLALLNKIFCLILLFAYLSLLIGKILNRINIGFNGTIYIFFIGILFIIIFIYYYHIKETNFLSIDFTHINTPGYFLKYVSKLFFFFVNGKNSRNSNLIFKSLIPIIKERCIKSISYFEMYLQNQNKEKITDIFLNKFCEEIFQYGVSKFYNDVHLKINYVIFLITEINNIKKALIILNSIDENDKSLIINYEIFLIRKKINKISLAINESNNINKYKYDVKEFKNLISKTFNLYYRFIGLILLTKRKNVNNFSKINMIGNDIIISKKQIEKNYKQLINTRTNNLEIIKLYSEFCKIVDGIENDNHLENNDITEKIDSNLSMENLNDKDNSYIIISTNKSKFGTILNCSISASKIFGYLKNEIIGKNIVFLIPDIIQQKNDFALFQLLTQQNMKNQSKDNDNFSSHFTEREIFGITKSRLLISITIKIHPSQTDQNDLVYIIEIMQYIPMKNDSLSFKENNNSKYCILTDDNFLIKSFTSNCLYYLKIPCNFINSNYYINEHIKQLEEDYLVEIDKLNKVYLKKSTHNNNNDIFNDSSEITDRNKKVIISKLVRQKIKNNLINHKYNKISKITWKFNEESILNNNYTTTQILRKNNYIRSNRRRSTKSISFNSLENKNKNDQEIELYMEVKKKLVDNKIYGYYFYFSKIYDESPKKLNNIEKKSDYNDTNTDEQLKFELNNNKNKGLQNLHCNTFAIKSNEKVSFHVRKSIDVRQNLNLLEESRKKKENLEVIDDSEFKVNKEFVPKDASHFLFNINNFSYEFVKDKNSDESLNKILKEEASNKIKVYNEKLKPLKKIKKKSKNESESESETDSNYSDSSSYSENEKENEHNNSVFTSTHSSSENNPKSDRKLSSKNNRGTLIEKQKIGLNKITPAFGKSVTITSNELNKNKVNKIKINNDSKKENINLKDHKNISGKYYKVNINNIYLLIYDFSKDSFVEVNKEEYIPKIEEVLSDISNKEKDEIYSFYSFQNEQNISKNKAKQKSENNNNNNNNINNLNNSLDREKTIERTIFNTINEKEEEAPIVRTKIYSSISLCIMLILGVLSLFFCLSYYSSINQIINLIKISIKLKYCNCISLYFTREITLLNFNAANIIGGEYILYPSKNRTTFINLCIEQLTELFKENQNMTEKLFEQKYSLSKNQTKYIEGLTFNTNFLVKGRSNMIISDLYGTLLQYNNAFYSLTSNAKNIHQSQSDVFVFINNNGVFSDIIQILIDVYRLELEQIIKKMKLILIVSLISFFIIFLLIYIILILAVLSANSRRINYVQIFFGINEDLLRNIMKNCEEVIDKLKNGGNIEYQDVEKSDSYIDENHLNNKKMKINKNDNNINNKKKHINKNNLLDELINIILLGIFFLIIYLFFAYISYYLFNLSNSALSMSNFFYRFQNFQLNIINIFNLYRQFVYDEQTNLQLDFSDILNNNILNSYDSIHNDIEYIQTFLYKHLDSKIGNDMSTKNLCSFNLTDYFESISECEEKYANILKYDFITFATNFIEEIRVKKNIVKYLLSTGKIIGRLNKYNLGQWMKDNLIPKKGIINPNTPNDTMFRLNLFNNETIHNSLNVIFINIIYPYLNGNRKIILETFSLEGHNYSFIIITILYLIIVIIIYFVYWFPIIISLNNSIYKTKNMLTIIPINILANQNNINLLLKKESI